MSKPRYIPKARVGKGGMGEVLRVEDSVLEREIAFKRVHKRHATRPIVVERFLREARVTARLDHPNIVPIYSLEHNNSGPPGYSMKLVEGQTLEEYMTEAASAARTGHLMPENLGLMGRLEVFLKVCDAMSFAHDRGVLHRDLKPANIMIGPFHEVYVMDWGLAKELETDETDDMKTLEQTGAQVVKTQAGRIIGTPEYMSPEQAMGLNESLGPASDQFALGIILREIVTLKPAIRLADPLDVVRAMRNRDLPPWPKPPGGLSLPPELVAICEKATAKLHEDRYDSVAQLAADVRRFTQGEPTRVMPDSIWRAAGRALSKHRELALGAMMLLTVAVAAVTVFGVAAIATQQVASQHREQRLAEVLSAVAHQASATDAELMRLQGLVQGMGEAAVHTLQYVEYDGRPVYTDADFDDPDKAPPMHTAVGHTRPVTFEHLTVRPAPGVDLAVHKDLVERATMMVEPMRRVYLGSVGPEVLAMGREVGSATVTEQGSPVVGSYFAVEQGIHFSYPGHGQYDDDYDPRERPWYDLGSTGRGPRWGSPHEDHGGQGILIVCAMPMYDDHDEFLGVASIEMTLESLITDLMASRALRGDVTTWLVNDQGRVVVRSDALDAPRIDDPPPFPVATVASAVVSGKAGHAIDNGTLYAWSRLETIGWWLVVSGDATAVEAR